MQPYQPPRPPAPPIPWYYRRDWQIILFAGSIVVLLYALVGSAYILNGALDSLWRH